MCSILLKVFNGKTIKRYCVNRKFFLFLFLPTAHAIKTYARKISSDSCARTLKKKLFMKIKEKNKNKSNESDNIFHSCLCHPKTSFYHVFQKSKMKEKNHPMLHKAHTIKQCTRPTKLDSRRKCGK